MKKRKLSKLQEIEDQYINLGYKGERLRKSLAKDKELFLKSKKIYDWRKYLLKDLDKLMRKYKIRGRK